MSKKIRTQEINSEPFTEPHLVQIFHGGKEVSRIVGGEVEFDHTVFKMPDVLEIHWDGDIVYRMENGTPTINLMREELLAVPPTPAMRA